MEQYTIDQLMYRFAEATKTLIAYIENDNAEKIDGLFIERQMIINEITKIQYDNEFFKVTAEALQLKELDNKLINAMNNKKREVLLELEKLKDGRNANETYLSNVFNKISFLDKTI